MPVNGVPVELPDFFVKSAVVQGKAFGEAVMVMNVLAEGRGVIVRIGWIRVFLVKEDEPGRLVLERLDDRGYLFGPGELIVVDELGGGWVVER